MSALDERPFPRGALIGAASLIAATVIGVGIHQIVKFSSPPVVEAPSSRDLVLQERDLRFVDEGGGINAFGGVVAVYDAKNGAFVMRLAETDGFIRAVLNSLTFERTKRSISADSTFALVLRSGNRLTLEDRMTGKAVNLGAFGGPNRTVFVRLLAQPDALS